jgi:hypothetical protein
MSSIHYSKYTLNTYRSTPYFQACLPTGYPIHDMLVKSRAFRKLPPNLRALSEKAKEWAIKNWPYPKSIEDIEYYYDDEGYELNPATKKRLTEEENDSQWLPDGAPDDFTFPPPDVEDIPAPDGGFPDPDTWVEPPPPLDTYEDPDAPTEDSIMRDIESHGREYCAKEAGLPPGAAQSSRCDRDLARMILAIMRGQPWPVSSAAPASATLSVDAEGNDHRGKGEPPLRLPQARILQALLPVAGATPSLSRAELCKKVGYTAISGTITRALNGIRAGGSSGKPYPGLLERGLVEVVRVDLGGHVEVNYRITAAGVAAYQAHVAVTGGKLPEVKDRETCTNDRYRKE